MESQFFKAGFHPERLSSMTLNKLGQKEVSNVKWFPLTENFTQKFFLAERNTFTVQIFGTKASLP